MRDGLQATVPMLASLGIRSFILSVMGWFPAMQRWILSGMSCSITGFAGFFVTAGLRDGVDGKLFYDHELLEVERADGLSSQFGRSSVSATTGPTPTSAAHLNDYTIAFLSQDAKDIQYSNSGTWYSLAVAATISGITRIAYIPTTVIDPCLATLPWSQTANSLAAELPSALRSSMIAQH